MNTNFRVWSAIFLPKHQKQKIPINLNRDYSSFQVHGHSPCGIFTLFFMKCAVTCREQGCAELRPTPCKNLLCCSAATQGVHIRRLRRVNCKPSAGECLQNKIRVFAPFFARYWRITKLLNYSFVNSNFCLKKKIKRSGWNTQSAFKFKCKANKAAKFIFHIYIFQSALTRIRLIKAAVTKRNT